MVLNLNRVYLFCQAWTLCTAELNKQQHEDIRSKGIKYFPRDSRLVLGRTCGGPIRQTNNWTEINATRKHRAHEPTSSALWTWNFYTDNINYIGACVCALADLRTFQSLNMYEVGTFRSIHKNQMEELERFLTASLMSPSRGDNVTESSRLPRLWSG